MATATARETGITCDQCGNEFILHEEYVYYYGRKLHRSCASAAAAVHRAEDDDPVEKARLLLESRSRVVLSRAQLRALVALAVDHGLEPVRKPDSGRQQWYGRMAGWSAARVSAGLSAAEVVGMWSDFIDAGRMPPLRAADLSILMDVIDSRDLPVTDGSATSAVTIPLRGLTPFP